MLALKNSYEFLFTFMIDWLSWLSFIGFSFNYLIIKLLFQVVEPIKMVL